MYQLILLLNNIKQAKDQIPNPGQTPFGQEFLIRDRHRGLSLLWTFLFSLVL